jgi:hypothetical protein
MADKADIRLLVSVEAPRYGGDAFHINARPIRIEDGKVRNIREDDWHQPKIPAGLEDLVISAQGNVTDDEPVYGWSVEYHEAFRVDERRAQTMAKTLRRIARGLERLNSELGYPESFEAYLARGWHDDNDYRWTDASGIRYRIVSDVAKVGKARV